MAKSPPTDEFLTARPIRTGANPLTPQVGCRRPRGLDDWLLWQTNGGRCRIFHGEGVHESTPDELILYAPGTPQFYQNPDHHRNWDVSWIIFDPRPHWHDLLNWPEISPGLRRLLPADPEIVRAIRHAIGRAIRSNRRGSERSVRFAMNHLENALLWCDMVNPDSRFSPLDPRLEKVIQFLSEHLANPLQLDDLATVAAVSRPQLVRLFRAQTGLSPMRYLENRRLERALELLEHTILPIERVAETVGYPNAFHFSTRFRQRFGRSPRAHRIAMHR